LDPRDLAAVESPCAIVVDENLDEAWAKLHRVCAKNPLIQGTLSRLLGGDS
jgi:hypothetical protein